MPRSSGARDDNGEKPELSYTWILDRSLTPQPYNNECGT